MCLLLNSWFKNMNTWILFLFITQLSMKFNFLMCQNATQRNTTDFPFFLHFSSFLLVSFKFEWHHPPKIWGGGGGKCSLCKLPVIKLLAVCTLCKKNCKEINVPVTGREHINLRLLFMKNRGFMGAARK